MKKYIIGFILAAIVFIGVGVYAAIKLQADEIGYKDVTIEDALNDLYSKTNISKRTCLYVSGTKGKVSAKYLCDPGDGIARYFYILKAEENQVKLIMEKNITDTVGSNVTMSWGDANTFFDEGHDGYNTKQAWKYVSIELPNVQDIVAAGGITTFDSNNVSDYYFGGSTDTRSSYAWLYNYSRGCSIYGCSSGADYYPNTNAYPVGYWTKDLANSSSNAWDVRRGGYIGTNAITDTTRHGVRPVITISSSQLSN